jgi:hypothetical protein
MRTVKRKAASTTPLIASATETTAAILNKQHVQLISMPLAAQTITGTVKGYALFSESDAAQDCRVQCEIRIISQAGTVRGTLLAANTDALSSEFVATPTNRRIPLLAATNTLTSVSAQEGDYLVVEIGHRTHVASGTSYTATVRWQDDPGSTDLPEDETDTDATKAPWLEFSQTLILNDTFDYFANAPATVLSAEQTNAVIPDFAPVDKPRDFLAEFNTLYLAYELANRSALQFVDTTDPTFIALPTVGQTSAAAFEDLGIKQNTASYSAEQTNAVIPDFAPVDKPRDFLAEFNTLYLAYELANRPALQFVDTTDPTFIALPTVGQTSAAAFETLGAPYTRVLYSAEQTNAVIPDFAPRDKNREILAEFRTTALNYNLVEPTTDSSLNLSELVSSRYVNRVYDTVAVKFIRWITNNPDTIGAAYPGPGVFGVTTMDYIIESSLVI